MKKYYFSLWFRVSSVIVSAMLIVILFHYYENYHKELNFETSLFYFVMIFFSISLVLYVNGRKIIITDDNLVNVVFFISNKIPIKNIFHVEMNEMGGNFWARKVDIKFKNSKGKIRTCSIENQFDGFDDILARIKGITKRD